MPKTIRFHLDESCDPKVALGLRQQGIDVTTAPQAALLRAQDQGHVDYALASGRMIITLDQDFLRMNAEGIAHAGVAYCKQGTRTIREIIDGLVLIWEVYEPEELVGRVEFL
jgi:hypothetical protein